MLIDKLSKQKLLANLKQFYQKIQTAYYDLAQS